MPLTFTAFENEHPLFKLVYEGNLEAIIQFLDENPSLTSSSEGSLDALIKLLDEDPSLSLLSLEMTEKGYLDRVLNEEDSDGPPLVSMRTSDGYSLLGVAITAGHLEVVRWLIEHVEGIEINKVDIIGHNALIWASSCGHLPIVEYLVEQGSCALSEGDAVIAAAEKGHVEVVRWLSDKVKYVSEGFFDGKALTFAAKNGHLNVVNCLIEKGKVNVDEEGPNGLTALMLAVKAGHLDVVQYLVEIGKAATNGKDKMGWSALDWAAYRGYDEIIQYLEKKILGPFLSAVKQSKADVVSSKLNEVSYLELRQAWDLVLEQPKPDPVVRALLQQELERTNKILGCFNVPPELICPISLELMLEPVLGSDTYTYERKVIEQALLIKKQSPMTRGLMDEKDLCPNQFVKEFIKKILRRIDLVRQKQGNHLEECCFF